MKYQEQFPTIWDPPPKPANPQTTKKPAAQPQPSALKEAFLTIWDSSKTKTAS